MKIQNLAIIFLVIAIPLIMILGYYLNLQQETLKLQAEYDTKLGEATKEGIKAFEVNTVDWSEWVSFRTNAKARLNATAAINTFITSLANNLNISGTAREFMLNYIPAVAVTMYDGYYVYAPTYTPVTKENDDGVQLFYDRVANKVTTEADKGEILYEAQDGKGGSYTYKYQVEDEPEITITYNNLTTNIKDAKTEYKHILNNKMSYSARYLKGTSHIVVNYTLDNRISVYGKDINKSGYLVYFDTNSVVPRAYTMTNDPRNDSDIKVARQVKDTIYNDTSIESEILEEQILYAQSGTYTLGTFKYIYDIEHEKLYYDEIENNFFTIDSGSKERKFLDKSVGIKMGSNGCRYKSISVLWGNSDTTTEYKKIYQVLNGRDKGKWCISIKQENQVEDDEKEIIDTEIKQVKLQELGLDDLRFSTIYRDYSAISYYAEAYAFTNWVKQNLGTGQLQQVNYKQKADGTYDYNTLETVNIDNIFNISENNDPEKNDSPIVRHKKETMKDNVTTNLNLSISNYNRRGIYDFKMPVLNDNDWEQAFSNISLITFFQGVPMGLKYYNNYAIATSTNNREYVDPGEIYFRGEEPIYHRVYCEKCKNVIYTGYRSVEYVLKEFIPQTGNNVYYYQHDKEIDSTAETACYYCLVNKENFVATANPNIKYTQAKSYNEALARERYYQKESLEGKLGVMIKYHYNVDGWTDIIEKRDLPEEQEVEIGVQTAISTRKPSIKSNDPFLKYVFVGWSETPDSATISYMPGDIDVFYEDKDLYAVWTIALSQLNWKKDYKFLNESEAFTDYQNRVFNSTSIGNITSGSISYIYIDEMPNGNGSRIQMIGNMDKPGKGAAWANFESDFLDVKKFEFNYNLNSGHSFKAAGFLFNIIETSGTLEGYMLSINFNYEMLNAAGNKNGAIFYFKYNKDIW